MNSRYNQEQELIVRKANELIQHGGHNLSEQQQKVVLYLISHISPYDEEFKEYEFDIPTFCDVCGINNHNGMIYEELQKAIKDIADKSVWIRLPDGTKTLFRWIEEPTIDPNNGKVTMRFHEKMRPYLLQLDKNYTQYELFYAVHFRSKYTIRLYELLKSYHYHELEPYTVEFTIDYLRQATGADNPTLQRYAAFKQQVLNRAITEINNKSDKTITFEEVKNKNKVIAIKFTIGSKSIGERIEVYKSITTARKGKQDSKNTDNE